MPSLLTANARSSYHKSPQPSDRSGRSSSPNYFGLVVDAQAPGQDSPCSASLRKDRWSPPSSSIRSAAASSPQPVPIEQVQAYQSFKKQVEERSFSLTSGPCRENSKGSISDGLYTSHDARVLNSPQHQTGPSRAKDRDVESRNCSSQKERGGEQVYKSGSPKRLLLSADISSQEENARRGSPPRLQGSGSWDESSTQSQSQSLDGAASLRANTFKDVSESERTSQTGTLGTTPSGEERKLCLISPRHAMHFLETYEDETLFLDLRVSTQYARSRVRGALNLCIPTTLLKRPSYDVHRLSDTFKDQNHKCKFENWRRCKRIIVYDHSSSRIQEAQSCVNLLQKFGSEGWLGESLIVCGGFVDFAQKFPAFIESGPESSGLSDPYHEREIAGRMQPPASSAIAPVIGGCPMPSSESPANPFFGNIRQNMDLIGGVGQMSVSMPKSDTPDFRQGLPKWLRMVTEPQDDGKLVSSKFLEIEKREQARMQDALSGNVTYGSQSSKTRHRTEIAGLEKGSKNRYNNIWPFEHTRMKLKGGSNGDCDYINANMIQTSISAKRYIATQAPIPATFVDFWNMVWQNDVRVIVMLTAESEGSQIKAHKYWSSTRYGPLKLTPLTERRATLEPAKIQRHYDRTSLGRRASGSVSSSGSSQATQYASATLEKPFVTVRKFTLTHENEPFARVREITQLQYAHWPDFGAPANPAHLLGLVQQCNSVIRSMPPSSIKPNTDERPVLVHCSAGCGRTGTFCAVDSVLDSLKIHTDRSSWTTPEPVDKTVLRNQTKQDSSGPSTVNSSGVSNTAMPRWQDEPDLVEKVVEELRQQRLSMVQSLRQFVLVYETILESMADVLHMQR